jgi:hypothetical protein
MWTNASKSICCRATSAEARKPIDGRNGQMFAMSTANCPGMLAAVAWASASVALNRPTRQAHVT